MSEPHQCVICKRELPNETVSNAPDICSECLKLPSELKSQAVLSFLGAAAMAVGGIVAFFWFRDLEANGGEIRTHALLVLAYNWLGSPGVFGLFMLFALGAGINGIVKQKNARERSVEIEELKRPVAPR